LRFGTKTPSERQQTLKFGHLTATLRRKSRSKNGDISKTKSLLRRSGCEDKTQPIFLEILRAKPKDFTLTADDGRTDFILWL
jgi:hypothetical protein